MIKGHGDDAYCYPGDITVDFSSNICPHADHRALAAHLASCGAGLIAHYPEPEAWSLERMLACRHGLDPACVVVTGGATEAIYLVAQAFRYRSVIPVPTFGEYEDACSLFPPLHEERTTLWLCNPNNPTGACLPPGYIEEQCRRHTLVVVDQSYEHYVAEPPQCPDCENLIVLHSMTKTYAVPGLRLGYLTAPAALAAHIRAVLRPWAVSAVAIEAGKFLLEHDAELRVRPDLAEARRLWQALNGTGGIALLPTQTTFMLCRLQGSGLTARQLKDHLAVCHGMLIRDASNFRGLSPSHFRVAAQSPSENDALVRAIAAFLHA